MIKLTSSYPILVTVLSFFYISSLVSHNPGGNLPAASRYRSGARAGGFLQRLVQAQTEATPTGETLDIKTPLVTSH